MSRRTFVRSATGVAACSLALSSTALRGGADPEVASAKPQAAEPSLASSSARVKSLGSARHLFIDDFLTARSENVALTVNPPQDRQLVLFPDKPWERGGITCYCNVLFDQAAGEYRLYYVPVHMDSDPIFRLALATSKDGITWDKPNLGVVQWNGSKNNNIVIEAEREGTVFIDPNAPAERRYAYLSGAKSGIFYYSSPDGIHFTKSQQPVCPHQSDSQISSFWDDQRKKYCHYFKIVGGEDDSGKWNYAGSGRVSVNANIPYPQGEPLGRSVARYEGSSVDELWTRDVQIVMARDPQDPTSTDLYTNAAQKYPLAPDVYVAFPTPYYHYNPAERAYLNDPALKRGGKRNDGVIETQLAVSRDGITWTRHRTPYFPISRYEDLYLQVVMGFPGLVCKPTHLEQYFSGYNFTHGDTTARSRLEGRAMGGVFRSVQRVDGFISADFSYTGGTLTTKPFTFDGKTLLLNLATSAPGEARVAICDEAGSEIDGFAMKQCRIVNGDFLDKKVEWTDGASDVSRLAGKPVRLRFDARGTKLFSSRFADI